MDPTAEPKVRPAAAALLYRETPEGVSIYLGRRSPKARFFPGYYAFVGGGLSRKDGPDAQEEAFRRCVVREVEEELAVSLDPGALRPAGRLLTPDFVPIRYDTRYYAAPCRDQEPEPASPELAGGRWFQPAEALELWDRGEILLASPVLLVLRTLRDRGFEEGLREWATVDTSGEDHEPYIELRPGVRFLPLRAPTIPPARTTNTAVVGGDGGDGRTWVVDPGVPEGAERDRLAAFVERHVEAWGPLAGVLLTHHHTDHAQAAGWLAQRFDAPVRAHPETRRRLDPDWPWGDDLLHGVRLPAGSHGSTGEPVGLRAVHTPGHAPGHLAFLEERSRALLAGDMVAGVGTILVDPGEGDMTAYMASLEELRTLGPRVILPGHGPFSDHPDRTLEGQLDHRRMRETRIREALGPEPRSVDALLPEVYDDVPEAFLGFAAQSLVAHLRKLEAEGAAREDGEERWRALP